MLTQRERLLSLYFTPPVGMSYQWCTGDLINAESQWVPVPRERHADLLGVGGGIIVSGGLTLCERSANVTATALERSKAAASKQVDDWWDNAAKLFGDRQRGFVAAVRTGYGPQDAAVGMEFTKSIEDRNDRP